MGNQKYFNQKDVAGILGVKVATLNSWRCSGKYNPPEVRMGKTILFPKDQFFKWLEEEFGHNLKEIDNATVK